MDSDAQATLRLTVASSPPDADVGESVRESRGTDLSIGRGDQCDWILPAKGVSRLHAQVRFLNGQYFLEDRSTNGMLRNGVALRAGEPVLLHDGDRLRIDAFDIDIAIHGIGTDATAPVAGRGPTDDDVTGRERLATVPTGFRSTPSAVMPPSIEAAAPVALDPLAWLSPGDSGSVGSPLAASPPLSHAPALSARFDAPGVVADAGRHAPVLPENWDLTRSQFAMPPAAAPVEAVIASRDDVVAAGPVVSPQETRPVAAPPSPSPSPSASPSPDRLPVEPLFLAVLEGVMDVLRARAELKNGFRMPATLIRRTENNPLKFAPTAAEAMARILAPSGDAFLAGHAAIADAMDDIRVHQVALLAGVREAFEDMVRQFEPGRFEEPDDARRRSRFAFHASTGPWERYKAHFERMAKDPDERFRRLFGDEFARAYEEQLSRRGSSDTTGERGS